MTSRCRVSARLLAVAALWVLCGCREEQPTEDQPAESSERDGERLEDDPHASRAGTADGTALAETRAAGASPVLPAGPAAGAAGAPQGSACSLSAPVRVRSGDAWFDVAASGEGFVVGGVASVAERELVFVVEVDRAGRLGAHAERPLEHRAARRRAAPRLIVRGPVAALVLPDGERTLRLFQTHRSGGEPTLDMTEVAEGASLQFAPAILSSGPGRWLVAWTDERTETRRVFAARVDGQGTATPTDLTPVSGSACAPVFVEGASPATLLFVDAREALSAVYTADASGPLTAPTVARPINMLTDPPRLEAAAAGSEDTTGWVTFTGIGAAATTAVGVFPLGRRDAPTTVVAGAGYGTLYADVTPISAGVLIAADVPQARPPGSPREIHLRVVDATGAPGPALTVHGPAGVASRARVASRGRAVAVAFQGRDGVFVALGECR